ncbi:MAG: PEP-CTERM sorting domain-containing protein [Methylomonas sp.]|jgi:hypothetical protein
MKKQQSIAISLIMLCLAGSPALADTIDTYTFNSGTNFFGALSGELQIDASTSTVVGDTLTVGSTPFFNIGDVILPVDPFSSGTTLVFLDITDALDSLLLITNPAPTNGVQVDLIPGSSINFDCQDSCQDTLTGGTLTITETSTSAVPEPSSIALLATGILGLLASRKKLNLA